jgi:tetratricopeptide (TPR) repeat protein
MGDGTIKSKSEATVFAFIFAFIICIGLNNTSPVSGDVSSLAKTIIPGTVLIQTYDANGRELGQGSGFFISEDGDIVTCAHVMKGFHRAVVITSDQKRYQVEEVISTDLINDLAVVSSSAKAESSNDYGPIKPRLNYDPTSGTLRPVTENVFASLNLNTTIPEVGQDIIVIGTPLGLENTVSEGIVSAIRGDKIQLTAPISPGSSGSPVLNMNGEVVGIVSSQMSKGQNLNFAVPAYLIQNALVKAWYNKAWDLFKQSKYNEAIQAYDKAIRLKPDYEDAWFNKGTILDKLGKYDEAIQAYDKAIQLKPDDEAAWFNKGTILDKQSKYDEAIQAYDKAIQLKPDDEAAWFNKGNALYDQKKYDETIQQKPYYEPSWFNKSNVLSDQKKYDEAIEAYDKAIQLKPDNEVAWFNKGLALTSQGKYDEAIKAYDEAIRLDPNIAKSYYAKGVALQALGRTSEANVVKAKADDLGYKG